MAQTVAEVLTAATDSVTVINDINTNGNASRYAGGTTDADGNAVAGDWEQADEYAQYMSKAQKQADEHHKLVKKSGGQMPTEEELKKQAAQKALDDDVESVEKLYNSENEKES